MKKLFLSLILAVTIVLSGCFELTQEITLNKDGAGTVSNTNDMSAIMGLARELAKKDMEKIADEVMDTTFTLADRADSIKGLSPEEVIMMKTGHLHIKMNIQEDKFISTMKFPFTKPGEIAQLNRLSSKLMQETISKQMGENPAMSSMGETPELSSFDDYYFMQYSNGLLIKSLNKEKYAMVSNDEYLKGIQEAASMGIPMSTTYVINLPRPVKKAEGKNIKVSDDKKKITIKVDIDEFFDDPSALEFRIEY